MGYIVHKAAQGEALNLRQGPTTTRSKENGIMAENDDIRIDVRRLVFEVRIVLDSVSHGLEALAARPEAILIKEELGVLRKLTAQAAEAIEAFAAVIAEEPGQ
jgi:hypothetical protein